MSPIAIPQACWRTLGVDEILSLPTTQSGRDTIIVFVDHFSKAVRLIPARSNLDSAGFARKFIKHVYPHYGLPIGIVSDRGSRWNSEVFRNMCSDMGVELKLTYSYHPRANGQVERYNRVIEEAVRHFVGPAMDDWDRYIPHIEFTMNNSVCKATGTTPFALNRLTQPLSPTDLAFGTTQAKGKPPAVTHKLYFHLAKQALSSAKQTWLDRENRNARPVHFAVGDQVMLSMAKIALHHPALRSKFLAKWAGPYAVLEVISPASVRIRLPQALKDIRLHDVFNVSVLKKYRVEEPPAEPQPKLSTATSDPDDAEYEVSAITSHDTCPHPETGIPGLQFLVQWKGYDASEATWLPVDRLGDCLLKVAEYLFTIATAARRNKLIAQFPKRTRNQLLQLLEKAQGTTARPQSQSRTRAPTSVPCRKRMTRASRQPPEPPAEGTSTGKVTRSQTRAQQRERNVVCVSVRCPTCGVESPKQLREADLVSPGSNPRAPAAVAAPWGPVS